MLIRGFLARMSIVAVGLVFSLTSGHAGSAFGQTSNATIDVTISGYLSVGTAGGIITLPDIVISETHAAALRAAGFVALVAPYWIVEKFDVSGATLKAYRASDGTDITSVIIGATGLVADSTPTSASNVADVVFSLATQSSPETGPLKLVISGLKALLANTASGDIEVTVGGAESRGSGLDSFQKIDSSLGSGATRTTLKAGSVVDPGGYSSPIAVSGPLTAQTIFVGLDVAGNDLGKQGSIFVAAIFSSGYSPLAVYFLNKAGSWVRFVSCATAPAIFDGVLTRTSKGNIPVVPTPTDLTAFVGVDVYVGYGVPSTMAACENMLLNGTYAKYHTIR